MFGKKKKAEQPRISIWDSAGSILYDGLLTGMTVPYDTICDLSLQFYNDPDPCEIHQNAVLSRVFLEIQEMLKPGVETGSDDLGSLLFYFSYYPDMRRVLLYFG